MAGVNKAILIGRLGKDPEVRHLEGGAAVANFPIATSEVYRDRVTNEKKEQTEWHNIVLWRGLAEIAEKYLKKGDMVYVEGKLRTRSWERDGVTRYTTEIVGDNLTMLTPRGGNEGFSSPAPSSQSGESQMPSNPTVTTQVNSGNIPGGEDDDLPF